jgi:RNA polymerase sigma-70 factor, ECF subfamily
MTTPPCTGATPDATGTASAVGPRGADVRDVLATPLFVELYDAHARFVWRAVLRLGVSADAVEDIVQEIFLVVHRRLADFERRSTARTWIYGIALRVARTHRRTLARRHLTVASGREDLEPLTLPEDPTLGPDAILEKTEAARLVMALLDELDDEQRELFVLAELEEMSLSEIAEVFGANTNTVASRLRAARRAFDAALSRARARDEWRVR